MLDNLKSAIKDLAAGLVESLGTATAEPALEHHPNGRQGVTLVREGYRLEVLQGPEESVRRHVFHDLGAFADFLNLRAEGEADIMLNAQEVVADFAPGLVSRDLVRCTLVKHPRFRRWKDLFGKGLTQRQAFEHVVSSTGDFLPAKATNGEAAGTEGDWIAGQLLKFAAAKESNYSCEVDERGTIRFQAASEKVTVSGSLPPRFGLRLPVFQGIRGEDGEEPMFDVTVHLRVEVETGRPPVFVFACPGLELVEHAALLNAADFLQGRLEEGFFVGLGELKTETVKAEIEVL
jgi:hypothetical protein